MKCASILPLAILFATSGALAQQSVTPASPNSTSLTFAPPQRIDLAHCPVGLDAYHESGVPRAIIADAESRPGPTINAPTGQVRLQFQQLRVTLTNPSSQEIVRAQITAHGFSDKWRAIELSNPSNAPDLAKTVDVVMDVKRNGHASRDLSLSHFTAVTSIELNSITYADGSTWHASSPGACSVTPDLFMLVAATPAR